MIGRGVGRIPDTLGCGWGELPRWLGELWATGRDACVCARAERSGEWSGGVERGSPIRWVTGRQASGWDCRAVSQPIERHWNGVADRWDTSREASRWIAAMSGSGWGAFGVGFRGYAPTAASRLSDSRAVSARAPDGIGEFDGEGLERNWQASEFGGASSIDVSGGTFRGGAGPIRDRLREPRWIAQERLGEGCRELDRAIGRARGVSAERSINGLGRLGGCVREGSPTTSVSSEEIVIKDEQSRPKRAGSRLPIFVSPIIAVVTRCCEASGAWPLSLP
jgi:hypothetical protein